MNHCRPVQAKKVATHLQKHGAPVDEPDAPLGGRFVWTKKIEKDLASGVSVSEFSRKAEQQRKEDRLVSAAHRPCPAQTLELPHESCMSCTTWMPNAPRVDPLAAVLRLQTAVSGELIRLMAASSCLTLVSARS